MEADLGYPGGKAKIIHKESDIIMAFAINKVNRVGVAEKFLPFPLQSQIADDYIASRFSCFCGFLG